MEAALAALDAWKAAADVLGSTKTREVFDALVDDLKAGLEQDAKVLRLAGAAAKTAVTLATTAEGWYDAVQASADVDEATKASLAVLKERKPLYFTLAFKDYQDAQTEQERAALERRRRRESRCVRSRWRRRAQDEQGGKPTTLTSGGRAIHGYGDDPARSAQVSAERHGRSQQA